MKKRIVSILSAFLIIVMGILKYPVFSYASSSTIDYHNFAIYNNHLYSNSLKASQYSLHPYAGFERNEPGWNVIVNSASSSFGSVYCFVCYNTVCRVIVGSFDSAPSFVTTYTSTNISSGEIIETTNTNVMTKNYNNKCWYSTFSANIEWCNYPVYQASVQTVLESLFGSDNSLGYLKNVGYHVDSYGLENNLAGTNEMVSWSNQSTTGIDLTQDRYSVEFAIKDTSVEYRRTLGNEPFFPDLPYSLDDAYKVFEDTLGWLAGGVGEIFKEGNATSAILKGGSAPTTTYGMVATAGTTKAKNLRYSFNALNTYKNSAVYDVDNLFKKWIDKTYGSVNTRTNFWRQVGDWINSNQLGFNLSYDIMARIVDTSNGNKGDWLVIQKHNTPYVMSDREDRLNGGVTCVTGVLIPSYDPKPDFTLPPPEVPSYNPDPENPDSKPIYLPTPVNTGYYTVDNSTGDTNVTNNYYNTTYVYDQRQYIENNVVNNDYENMQDGFDLARLLPNFLGLYLRFFGAFLPGWAAAAVALLLPITISLIVIRAIKGVIPFV